MKFHLTLPSGRRQSIDTQLEITHALLGHRDIERDRPDIPKVAVTPEQHAAALQFALKRRAGRYEVNVLEWLTAGDDREAAKARWPAPEWIDLEIVPAYKYG